MSPHHDCSPVEDRSDCRTCDAQLRYCHQCGTRMCCPEAPQAREHYAFCDAVTLLDDRLTGRECHCHDTGAIAALAGAADDLHTCATEGDVLLDAGTATALADWLSDYASTLACYGDRDRTSANTPGLRLAHQLLNGRGQSISRAEKAELERVLVAQLSTQLPHDEMCFACDEGCCCSCYLSSVAIVLIEQRLASLATLQSLLASEDDTTSA